MADEIHLIDESGQSHGLTSRDQALFLAQEKEVDLVLINEKANPPIAKLMDYGKFIYNQEKQIAKQKAKTKDIEIKEIRFGMKISDHDLSVKINKAKKFFDLGDKVKVTVQLRGREMMFRDKVNQIIERFKNESGGTYEKPIERLGNRFFAILTKGKNETKNS